jgi:hypothetical protein
MGCLAPTHLSPPSPKVSSMMKPSRAWDVISRGACPEFAITSKRHSCLLEQRMQKSGKRAGRHSLVRYAAVLVIDHRVSIAGQDQMRRRAGVDAGWSTVERSSFPQANDSERRPSRIHQLLPQPEGVSRPVAGCTRPRCRRRVHPFGGRTSDEGCRRQDGQHHLSEIAPAPAPAALRVRTWNARLPSDGFRAGTAAG